MSIVTYTPPNRVTCIPGAFTASGAKLLVATVLDPTVGGQEVTVTIDGTEYVSGVGLTLTARGSTCWTGVIDATLPDANTVYQWSCSQTVSGTEWTDGGTIHSAPASGTDWNILVLSCDNNNDNNIINSEEYKIRGSWPNIKARHVSSPYSAMLFIDDIGYADSSIGYADDWDGTTTGLESSGADTTDLNDMLFAWCSIFGMLGPTETSFTDNELQSEDLRKVIWGREENRSYCRKNINCLPQWGDHEFSGGDPGWDTDIASTFPNGRWQSSGVDGAGKTAWDAFLGLIQPDYTGADTIANHWAVDIGDITIATLDGISNSNGSGITAALPTKNQITTLYGSTQITDVQTALNTDAPFKLLAMGHSVRYMVDTPAGETANLAQHPIFDHVLTEYQALFTKNTGNSLMNNPKTNGAFGCLLVTDGDFHRHNVITHHSDAYSSELAEQFTCITTGTLNGWSNFSNTTGLVAGDVFESADGHTKATLDYDAEEADSGNFYSYLSISIRAYDWPKELYVNLYNQDDEAVYSKKMIHTRGNFMYGPDETSSFTVSSIDSE